MALVDKNINNNQDVMNNPNKSVYSIGDFRHNLIMKEDSDYYTSKVSHVPRTMFAWDDGKRFNPKYKKDK